VWYDRSEVGEVDLDPGCEWTTPTRDLDRPPVPPLDGRPLLSVESLRGRAKIKFYTLDHTPCFVRTFSAWIVTEIKNHLRSATRGEFVFTMTLLLCAYCALTLALRTAEGSMALLDLGPTPPAPPAGEAPYPEDCTSDDGERPMARPPPL
jgi:hypothetical protein